MKYLKWEMFTEKQVEIIKVDDVNQLMIPSLSYIEAHTTPVMVCSAPYIPSESIL